MILMQVLLKLLISIHAPVKGATASAKWSAIISSISIHAPVKGATSTTATRC